MTRRLKTFAGVLASALSAAAISVTTDAAAADKPIQAPAFVHDARVEQVAEAYAKDAIDDARDKHAIALDGSEKSIQWVERILSSMHDAYVRAQPKPSEDVVMTYAKAYGSYIGEVYRHHHAGEWGIVTLGGQSFPGMHADGGSGTFWPWGRVRNRLINGPEDNVADYYAFLLKPAGPSPEAASAAPAGK